MEIKEYFEGIRKVIIENLNQAESEILIAMAWFTNNEIFEVVLNKLEEIPVSLVVINDDINNRIDGLDFQKFIDKGGHFYFGSSENPMHNKFCIIDHKTLITGSYNYTYLAENINSENIIVFKGVNDVIQSYTNEFQRITTSADKVNNVNEYLFLHPIQKDLFSYKNYGLKDIYSHIQLLKSSGNLIVADAIQKEIEKKSDLLESNNFQINDIIYRQWKQDYYADKIQVLNNTLVLFYRTKLDSGGWIHGPKAKFSWILVDSSNPHNYRGVVRITNIKLGGKKIITSTETEEIIHFSKQSDQSSDLEAEGHGYALNENNELINDHGYIVPIKSFNIPEGDTEMSCEIHFDITGFPLETVHLIEGLGHEDKGNHWHCFDINLRLNREKLT